MPASRPKSSKLCRVKAGIRDARSKGKAHGRLKMAAKKQEQIKKLKDTVLSNSQIARKLKIGRTSAIRLLKE